MHLVEAIEPVLHKNYLKELGVSNNSSSFLFLVKLDC